MSTNVNKSLVASPRMHSDRPLDFEPGATDKRWLVAREADSPWPKRSCRPCADCAQKEFLDTTGFWFKESNEQYRCVAKTRRLPHDEIRPLLRHMLTQTRGESAILYALCTTRKHCRKSGARRCQRKAGALVPSLRVAALGRIRPTHKRIA